MEQEIERQRAELLRDFVTAASHDFKTPLTVMSLNLELMRRTRDPDKLQQRLDTLEKQVWRLNRMLEDMMVMLRLDAGYQSFPLASLEVNGLAREVFEAHQPAALEKRLELRFQPAAGALLVLADEDDLNLALSKLIDNAIHFTPDGGKITLAVSTSESRAIIEVRDTGSGISAEDLPHIFDQFYRADKARSMETGGSGLGLPIAKRIIELHDGTLDAESTLGGGSTFRISLPLSSEAVESALEAIGNGVVPSKSSSDAQGGRDVQARETPIEE
jgi:signal transduction histidine kinase